MCALIWVFRSFRESLNITFYDGTLQVVSTAFHLTGNTQVERCNEALCKAIRFCLKSHRLPVERLRLRPYSCCGRVPCVPIRDMEVVILASASTSIASTTSAFNKASTLSEPGLYLIYELADKHDYQNQQLTIYKGTVVVEMIA